MKVGFDGIALAGNKKGKQLNLTRIQLYKATAREVWDGSKFIKNPYKKWSDIDPSLPPKKARALTYSEMMNGGRAQMDEQAHERELELKRREATLICATSE